MSPPHIVIIPAACQPSTFYTPLTNALTGLSLPAHTIVPLPSINPASNLPPNHDFFSADVSTIRSTILSILSEGADVVVLMHSYGGLPGSAALKGLGKAERGDANAVVRLIYVCSFVLGEGESMPGAGDVEGLKGMAGEAF